MEGLGFCDFLFVGQIFDELSTHVEKKAPRPRPRASIFERRLFDLLNWYKML
jgi:hypothetical protein